jgi:hypothetical protein
MGTSVFSAHVEDAHTTTYSPGPPGHRETPDAHATGANRILGK